MPGDMPLETVPVDAPASDPTFEETLRSDPILQRAFTTGGIRIIDTDIDGPISASKIGPGYLFSDLSGTIALAQIPDGLITGAKIGDAQIANIKIVDVAATKLTGDIASARMTLNVVAAINLSSGVIDAARVTAHAHTFAALTGSLADSQVAANSIGGTKIQNNTITATQVSGTAGTITASGIVIVNASKAVNEWTVTGLTDLQGAAKIAGAASALGFFGSAGTTKQSIFSNVIANNVASGWQAGNIYDFANLVSPTGGPYNYTSDAPVIGSTLYKICEWIERVNNQIIRGHNIGA